MKSLIIDDQKFVPFESLNSLFPKLEKLTMLGCINTKEEFEVVLKQVEGVKDLIIGNKYEPYSLQHDFLTDEQYCVKCFLC